MDANTAQVILATVGAAVALFTAWQAVNEYRHQGTIRRVDFFLEARRRLNESAEFQNLINLLESDSPALSAVQIKTKIAFVGFFEEVALLLNSRVIRAEIAQYMFGYYALKCWESKNFWMLDERPDRPLDKENEPYWAVFRAFVKKMEPIRDQLMKKEYNDRRYSL